MSYPRSDVATDEPIRVGLGDEFAARFGTPDVAVFELSANGDAVLCLRVNTLDASKTAPTLRCADAMIAYCADKNLAPRCLVFAKASGMKAHDDRADLGLIESLVNGGRVTRVLWRDAAAISRSTECALRHHTALQNAGAELHLLDRGRIDAVAYEAAVPPYMAFVDERGTPREA